MATKWHVACGGTGWCRWSLILLLGVGEGSMTSLEELKGHCSHKLDSPPF